VRISEMGCAMFESLEEILSCEEAASALHIGKNALYKLLLSHELKGFRNGRVWLIPKKALEEYIRKQTNLN